MCAVNIKGGLRLWKGKEIKRQPFSSNDFKVNANASFAWQLSLYIFRLVMPLCKIGGGCGSGKITYVIGFQNSIYVARQPQNAIWAKFFVWYRLGKMRGKKKNRIKQHKINQTKRTHRAEERRQNSTFTNG